MNSHGVVGESAAARFVGRGGHEQLRRPCRAALFSALFGLLAAGAEPLAVAASMQAAIEADWRRQAEAWQARPSPTQGDAAGAVDGVKDGKYAFHTGHEANPWWQVDLGAAKPIARIVVFNRLDYAPGLHNADNVLITVSADGKQWRMVHDNLGKHFGGVSGASPLTVTFEPGAVRARFVRLQLPSKAPVFFHLDEVEIYGPDDPAQNLALRQPADQSSVSIWSTMKLPKRASHTPIATAAVNHFIERGQRLAAHLRNQAVDTAPFERAFATAARQVAGFTTNTPADFRQEAYFTVRRTLRELVFRKPEMQFDRLLITKRFGQETYPDVCLNHMPWVSRPGGDLCILRLRGPANVPEVRPILQGALGPGHVHGMDLNWDATRIVFGYAKAKKAEPPKGWLDRATNYELRRTEEPTHLYEIGVDGTGLRQLTDSRDWSDLDPCYAPSGEIVFVSERCGCSLQCNEWDKDETSCNLYIMPADGTDIRRLSVTKDGDYLPHVLADGTIGYTRWEYQERGWANVQSIWYVRPDGTGADALFKQHFNDPWALEDMRSLPDTPSPRMVAIATGHHTLAAGPVVLVHPSVGLNNPAGIAIVTPGVRPPEGGMSGTPVTGGGVFDQAGYYMTPWPLSADTFLVSYSYGTGKTGVASEIDPTGYAIYLIDVFGTKELLYRDESISCFTPIPLRPRARPPSLAGSPTAKKDHAVLTLAQAAYAVPGIAPEQVRYLRVAARLPWPYDNTQGGQRYTEKAQPNNWTPVRVLGVVPLAADGSAHFTVPPDTAVYFQLLDVNFMELRRMRSFISFQPGEQRGCVGCHETRAEAPPVGPVPLATLQEAVAPAPPPWGTQPISFLREIQPILDRHCGRCHCGLKPAAGLDFSGGLTSGWNGQASPIAEYGHNRAFETLLQKGLVSWSDVQGDAHITRPLEQGSHRSKLVEVLRGGGSGRSARLSPEEWETLVTWIDLNAPYHDRFADKRPARPAYSLPADQDLRSQLTAIHERRCGQCHAAAAVSRLDWIDLRDGPRSLFLDAPLAKEGGGRAKCSQAVYQDQYDPDYQHARELVAEAVRRAWEHPRRDLRALQDRSAKPGRAPARSAQLRRDSR